MSEEQLKAFLEKVKADTSLQEKLKAAADVDAVVAIAKEEGFMFSAVDLTKVQPQLSEKELEGVSGGGVLRYGHNEAMGGGAHPTPSKSKGWVVV